jgi:hypothetical protein
MPTPDELRDVQLENAKADQRFWDGLHGLHTDTIEGHKGVIAAAERAMPMAKQARRTPPPMQRRRRNGSSESSAARR